ncbi:MAG TPA: hypothetical protein VLJ37_03005 [bacterium]|nr:hypothetical protein [bacterium]
MPATLGHAAKITVKTLPFILLRMGLYLAFGFLFCLYWAAVFFLGQGAAALHDYARVAVWIVALILPFPLIRLFREYFLYVLKIAHVAVIVQLALRGSLPEGKNQVEWGKEKVMARFKETSVLFVVDRLVMGVIRAVNRLMEGMANLFGGVPGLQSVIGLAKVILRFSLTYVDEAVMARNFMKEEETVWQSAQTGLVLYAQSWKEILKTAIFIGIAAILSYGLLSILYLIPFLGLAALYPKFKILLIAFALIFAAVTKLALFDPWALTSMILVYLETTKDMVPDRGWEEKIAMASKKFRQIQEKAVTAGP